MSEFIEIEFKNILSKDEYDKVISYFNLQPEDCFEQLNIYYDTKDLILNKNKMALRTRIINNTVELTLKQKTTKSTLETTDYITRDELNKLLKEHVIVNGAVIKKLNILNIDIKLYEIARLKTIRYEIDYFDNIIALDKSIYYNKVDYEIELETKNYDYGKKVFNDLLKTLNIKRLVPKYKIARAFEYKKSLNNQRF